MDGYEQDFELDHEHAYDAEHTDDSGPVDEEDEEVEVYLPVDIEYIEIDG